MEMAKRFGGLKKISKRLSDYKFRRLEEIDFSFSEEELFDRSMEKTPSLLFLGYYSREGIELALQKYGVYERFRELGFGNLQLVMDTRDPYRQRLAIYSVIEGLNARLLLSEIVVRRKFVKFAPPFSSPVAGQSYEMLFIEWLCMQDPRKKFTLERPRLPGQEYPGLGGGKIALHLISMACRRLRLAGVISVPEYFHNAQMYSRAFMFIDPDSEGKRRAIWRDLMDGLNLANVSWAIERGCVYENGKPFKWFIDDQMIPLQRDLKAYFTSSAYLSRVREAEAQYLYTLDEKRWEKQRKQLPAE